MPFGNARAGRTTTQGLLTGTVLGTVMVAALYWAQPVLIPVALAVFLAFPLAPVVAMLERWRMRRTFAVVTVVVLVSLLLGGFGWLVNVQISRLIEALPTYTENIQAKVRLLRQLGDGDVTARLGKLGQDIAGEWDRSAPSDGTASADGPAAEPKAPEESKAGESDEAPEEGKAGKSDEAPKKKEGGVDWESRAAALLTATLGSFANLAFALVLAVFILLDHATLRNRVVALSGSGRTTATTKALADAGHRIERYLSTQAMLNGTYGVIWGLGLYLLGVEFALLWGLLAAVLRYIPFIGATIAAVLPITLSLAQFPGWWQPLTLIVFLIVLELVCNNVLEPWLYGRSIGVSPVAMIIAAAFWTFLWGPIGLILSGPLTVCLVVIGTHVHKLRFLAVLLGNAPPMGKDISFYQRLLARDDEGAELLIREAVDGPDPDRVYDDVLMPTFVLTKRDRERDFVTVEDEAYIVKTMEELLALLPERPAEVAASEAEPAADAAQRICILACPARGQADRLALTMLRQLLDPSVWHMEVLAPESLTSEVVALAVANASPVTIVGALAPGGLSHARQLCKRLRAGRPNAKILVGRWGLDTDVEADRAELREAGADMMATSLIEARKLLGDWRSVWENEPGCEPVKPEAAVQPA